MLAEFDRRKGWCQKGMRSCSQWLNWKCGLSYTTAREKLRVAHCLEKLPHINEAFEKGELSYSKVRDMSRVATDDNEDILINVAKGGTAEHVAKLVRKYQRVDEEQNSVEAVDEYLQRKLNYFQDENGMWVLHAKLPQVEGGLLIKALEELIRQEGKNASAEAPEEEQHNAPVVEKTSNSQNRADALAKIAEHFIATATVDDENGGVQTLAGHERCQVVLHLSVDSLKAEHKHSNNCSSSNHNPQHMDYQWISKANTKRFSSDASLYTVLEDTYGNVLNLSRKTRTVSTALKRALNLRDTTCRFPGCCANNYVDFHHIQHWSNGGRTGPDNLIKLCRFHHRLLHKGHYTVHIQEQTEHNHGQKWIFKTADGEIIESNPTLTISGPTMGAGGIMEVKWPDINSKTGVPRWRGEPLDYPRALRDLFWCKHQKKSA